jgi:hypothetical protein
VAGKDMAAASRDSGCDSSVNHPAVKDAHVAFLDLNQYRIYATITRHFFYFRKVDIVLMSGVIHFIGFRDVVLCHESPSV